MIRPHAAVLAMAVLVGACVRNAGVEPPAPMAHAYTGGPIVVGRWGAGPVRPGAFFDIPSAHALFPEAQATAALVRVAPDERLDMITVRQNGAPLVELDDSYILAKGTKRPLIGKARVVGVSARGPHGERLGMTWDDVGFDLAQCEPGQDEDKNRMVCARPGDGAVNYVFAVPGWDSLEIPPIARLRASAVLAEIVWIAPRGAGA
jgi:hypothetical protein